MPEFVRIAAVSELPAAGETKEFTAGGKVICIANVDGHFRAMDNVCLHLGASLGQGTVEHGKVVCPWHGWRWNPVSGAAIEDPRLRLRTYELQVRGDDVLVGI